MPTRLKYETTEGGLILTKCPVYDCTLGGYYCVNCKSHSYKDMDEKVVICSKIEFIPKGGFPPQRVKYNHKRKKR